MSVQAPTQQNASHLTDLRLEGHKEAKHTMKTSNNPRTGGCISAANVKRQKNRHTDLVRGHKLLHERADAIGFLDEGFEDCLRLQDIQKTMLKQSKAQDKIHGKANLFDVIALQKRRKHLF